MKKIYLIILYLISYEIIIAQNKISIIPKPVQIETLSGYFQISEKTSFKAETSLQKTSDFCIEMLKATGFKFLAGSMSDNSIVLEINPKLNNLGDEGYELSVSEKTVLISAFAEKGLIYGFQTFRQLLPPQIYSSKVEQGIKWQIPCVKITDYPRFKWRAMMLDVSRNFQDIEFVKKYIDWLAVHKINIFHFHLTDDEGWRIEIKKYPKLTEIGAWRGSNEALPPAWGSGKKRYGGFYTQEQIKDLVKFAAKRNVQIMPEIELPGHSRAIAVAYPEILCLNTTETESAQGVKKNVFCASNENNFKMLDGIFAEIADLFPFEYIHIGGDEVVMDHWANCPKCKELKEKQRFQKIENIQNYFVRRVENIIAKRGKKMIGWNEILDGGDLLKSTAVMSWSDTKPGFEAAKRGYPVVMSPAQSLYFDMMQAAGERGHSWAGIVTLDKVYSFDPLVNNDLNDKEKENIFGVAACLWSEYLNEPPQFAEHQSFPRICALAEVAWTPQNARDYKDFLERLWLSHIYRLDYLNIKYRIEPPKVKGVNGKIIIQKPFSDAIIRYTTNGSEPTLESKIYTEPFLSNDFNNVIAKTFTKSGKSSLPVIGAERNPVGNWSPEKCSVDFKIIDFDVSEGIDSKGIWYFTFNHRSGKNTIIIKSVKFTENNIVIANDEHEGQAGLSSKNNKYRFPVLNFKKGNKYVLKVEMRSDGGTDSNGELSIIKSDWEEPIVTVETNIEIDKNTKIGFATDWFRNTYFTSAGIVKKDSYFIFNFEKPFFVNNLEVITGRPILESNKLPEGILYVSENGIKFEKVADFKSGNVNIKINKILKAVKIVATDNTFEKLIIQDLKIK